MKKTALLKPRDLKALAKQLPEWSVSNKSTNIKRTFSFDSHVEALVFIARVTVHAEVLQHHPDIKFTYQKVAVTLTTHDVKGLTKVDVALAKRIDALL